MFFVNMSGRSTGSGQRRNESVAENPCSDASAVLPVLLPFLILTGILIHTNMAGKLLQPVEVIWNKVLGVSAAGAYAVIVGALCGYPVGAKITSDLYENHQISGVDMHQENLDGTQLIAYAPVKGEQIYMQN